MSFNSITQQPNSKSSEEEKKAAVALLAGLRSFAQAFWAYSEEAGDVSTKSYEGLL